MKGGNRLRIGRRTFSVPEVPSMTAPDRSAGASGHVCDSGRAAPADYTPIDHKKVQYLDRVRAIFRPVHVESLAPGLERFVGREDIFRHVGTADTGSDGTQAMMQCPSYWPDGARRVPIRDLEILEILEDQDVRAG